MSLEYRFAIIQICQAVRQLPISIKGFLAGEEGIYGQLGLRQDGILRNQMVVALRDYYLTPFEYKS